VTAKHLAKSGRERERERNQKLAAKVEEKGEYLIKETGENQNLGK